jgi:Zn-dependent protease with chaperone function
MSTIPGHYANGRSARVRPVRIQVEAQFLRLFDHEGEFIAAWPAQQLTLCSSAAEEIVLSPTADSDERLTIRRTDLPPRLEQFLPLKRRHDRLPWMVLALSLPVLVGLYFLLPLAVRPIAALVPAEWEAGFGRQIAQSFDSGMGACTGAHGQRALEKLAARIAAANDMALPEIRVLLHKDPNAVALPGGHVRLFSGFLSFAASPEEIAAVMAHELAHVRLRHVTQKMVRSAGLGLVVSVLTGDASGLAAGAVHALVGLSYSRDDEAEADAEGLAMLAATGISGVGMESFFRRIAEREGSGWSFLSTHPDSAGRGRARNGASLAGGPAMNAEEFAAVKAMCAGR